MNRLVIVGNGFDLAHGLPTGYCDFIDWYWVRVSKDLKIKMYEKIIFFEDNIFSLKLRYQDYYEGPEYLKEMSNRKNIMRF